MTTRRTHLTRLGLATAAGLTAAAAAPARAVGPQRPEQTLTLWARRKQITLPVVPPLGGTYIVELELFDSGGAPAGSAFAGAEIVGLTLQGPVVSAHVILKLKDGEIHYQRVINRFGAFPWTATGAIQGGTGTYAGIRGEVDIAFPNADRIDINVRPIAPE